MPTPSQILAGLHAIARHWTAVAVAWHVVVAAGLIAVLLGWRPRLRVARTLIALLPASVAAFAFAYGNPFNGLVFTATTVALVVLADRDGEAVAGGARGWALASGAAMIAFGWVYPHFVDGGAIAYLYAAPLGLVPCPSLSMAIGLALVAGGGARAWRLTLAGVGAAYGLFGALRLGVVIDIALLAGALALGLAALARPRVAPQRRAAPSMMPAPSRG